MIIKVDDANLQVKLVGGVVVSVGPSGGRSRIEEVPRTEASRLPRMVRLGSGRFGRRGVAQTEIGEQTFGRMVVLALTAPVACRTVALRVVRTGVEIRIGRALAAWIEVTVSSSPR